MAGSKILTLFGTYPQQDRRKVRRMLTYPCQVSPMLDSVNSNEASIGCKSGKQDGEITADKSGDSWTGAIGSERSGSSGANSLRRILASLVSRIKCSNVTGDGVDGVLPVQSGSSTKLDSVARLNSALRRWSVECKNPTPADGTAAVTVMMMLREQREMDTPVTTMKETSQSMVKEAPEPVEQDPRTNSVEEEVDGTEYREREPETEPRVGQLEDYYEILQISRNADLETIHRVYRIMALRFHPDNTNTGDLERFLLLKQAYQVLSDPAQRAAYDAAHITVDTQPLPVFDSKDFVYGIKGEMNRRLGVLSLLYHKRRLGEGTGGISVLEMEKRMAFPREYLTFTLWYLRSKRYIVLEENSDYALTYEGVDFVEANSVDNDAIRQLLTAGTVAEYTRSGMSFNRGSGPSVATAVTVGPRARMVKPAGRKGAWRRAERNGRRRSIGL